MSSSVVSVCARILSTVNNRHEAVAHALSALQRGRALLTVDRPCAKMGAPLQNPKFPIARGASTRKKENAGWRRTTTRLNLS